MTDAVERLRQAAQNEATVFALRDMVRDKDAENERLRARIDAVREVYAGMEGFIPQTAPEAYLLRITKQMYDAALGGEGKNDAA